VVGRNGEHDLVAVERLERDAAVPAADTDDAELELTPGDLLDDGVRVGDRKRDVHLRVELLELGEDDRQDAPAGPGRAADLEATGELPFRVVTELLEDLLLHREQPLRAAVEPHPGLGRLDAPAGTVEQLLPEPLFERANLKAHGRLRDAELVSGLGETPPLDHRAECGQLLRVHNNSL
jgi:hypothetical protein